MFRDEWVKENMVFDACWVFNFFPRENSYAKELLILIKFIEMHNIKLSN